MKKNSEKIILSVAAVAALGLGFLGYSKLSSVEEDFVHDSVGSTNNDPSVVGAELLGSTLKSLGEPLLSPAPVVGEKKRTVDLFKGVPLFARKPEGEEVAKPFDPILDESIHADIPNIWWLENGLQEDMSYSDGPTRDHDDDGFTNAEEFEAKTNPADAKDLPELVKKIQFVKYESIGYFLWFSSSLGPQQYEFKIVELPAAFEKAAAAQQESYLRNTLPFARTNAPVAPNGNIFKDVDLDKKWKPAVKSFDRERFILKGVVMKEVKNENTDALEQIEFASIEDTKTNKLDVFDIPRNPRKRAETVRYDRSAVLVLNAAGEEGKEFKVEENTAFALPPTAKEKNYLLKSVSAEVATVEYKDKDGKTQTLEIKLNE